MTRSRNELDNPAPGPGDGGCRRNLFWLAFIESGWGLGGAFVSPGAVIPLLASALGASLGVVGLLPGLSSIAMSLPGLLAAHRTAGLPRQLGFVTRWHVLPTLAYLPLAYLAYAGSPGTVSVCLLFACLTLYYLSVGYVIPVWMAFVGKVSGSSRRGAVWGIISTVNLLGGAAGAWLAGKVLTALPAPTSYAVAVLAAFVVVNLANLGWLGIDESEAPGATEAESATSGRGSGLVEYVRELAGSVAGNAEFVRFLVAQQFLLFHQVLGAFYLLYARNHFGASPEAVLGWSGVAMVSQALGSILYSAFGDRVGARATLVGSQLLLVAAMGLMLLARSADDVLPVAILLGAFYGTYFNAKTAALMELAEGPDTAAYLAVCNGVTMPGCVLIPAAAGWGLEWFGYPTILSLALLGALCGTALLALSGSAEAWDRSLELARWSALTVRSLLFAGVRRAAAAVGLW